MSFASIMLWLLTKHGPTTDSRAAKETSYAPRCKPWRRGYSFSPVFLQLLQEVVLQIMVSPYWYEAYPTAKMDRGLQSISSGIREAQCVSLYFLWVFATAKACFRGDHLSTNHVHTLMRGGTQVCYQSRHR